MEDVDLWCHLNELVGEVVWKDSHAFASARNFGVVDGRLKMVDYGGRDSQEALKECAEKIYSDFNFSYNRKERLKQLQLEREEEEDAKRNGFQR